MRLYPAKLYNLFSLLRGLQTAEPSGALRTSDDIFVDVSSSASFLCDQHGNAISFLSYSICPIYTLFTR